MRWPLETRVARCLPGDALLTISSILQSVCASELSAVRSSSPRRSMERAASSAGSGAMALKLTRSSSSWSIYTGS